jgi:formamidopyrimidine-DNA glycosylase
MPELPEVETIRQDLSKSITKKRITDIVVNKEKIIKNNLSSFLKILRNNNFAKIDRRGKLLILHLYKNDKYFLIHLRMTGQLIYQHKKKIITGGHPEPFSVDELPNKYSHIIFTFADKSKLFFNDMRQFGYMKLVDKDELNINLKRFGIEPLTNSFTLDAFTNVFKNKKSVLKAFLLNQKYIAGIGNIYADEICFKAGVKPSRNISSLTSREIKNLYNACQFIINKAIIKRGTSFSDFRDGSGKQGNFLKYLKVYGRSGKKCLNCKQSILKKIRLAGRGTVFCQICQK